jgi:hypothetical protein
VLIVPFLAYFILKNAKGSVGESTT